MLHKVQETDYIKVCRDRLCAVGFMGSGAANENMPGFFGTASH